MIVSLASLPFSISDDDALDLFAATVIPSAGDL